MRITNRRKFRNAILITLTIIFLTIIFINSNKTPKYTETYKTIYIVKNDTLWNIAEKYKRPDQDIRDYIHKIEKLNNMKDAAIYEGQALQIIIYEEVK